MYTLFNISTEFIKFVQTLPLFSLLQNTVKICFQYHISIHSISNPFHLQSQQENTYSGTVCVPKTNQARLFVCFLRKYLGDINIIITVFL